MKQQVTISNSALKGSFDSLLSDALHKNYTVSVKI